MINDHDVDFPGKKCGRPGEEGSKNSDTCGQGGLNMDKSLRMYFMDGMDSVLLRDCTICHFPHYLAFTAHFCIF